MNEPQFFTRTQFATAAAAIDLLIPAKGRVLSAEQIAARADEFLHSIESPYTQPLRQALDLLEHELPLLIGRAPPFTALSPELRRRVLDKIVSGSGQLRDLARALKLISTFAYYTDPKARRAIGYVEFEDRPRFPTLDTTPHTHQPPT